MGKMSKNHQQVDYNTHYDAHYINYTFQIAKMFMKIDTDCDGTLDWVSQYRLPIQFIILHGCYSDF